MSRHPIQPTEVDAHGTVRFKQNAIVRRLLDFSSTHGLDLNRLAAETFDQDDRVQFAQLIGYSVSGFGDLGYVDDDTRNAVDLMTAGASEANARIESMAAELNALRSALREPMARLFGVCPEDLGGDDGR